MHVASWIWVLIPITAIVCGIFAGVAKRWIRLKERELQLSSEMTAEKAAQYAAHTERLEQRVRVLERIATDKGIDLADEIERLRDDRPH
jgi:ABC-type phosphate transport system auxiliary subunit